MDDRELRDVSEGEHGVKGNNEVVEATVTTRDELWETATVGHDRSSFMRCGGGRLCNEPGR